MPGQQGQVAGGGKFCGEIWRAGLWLKKTGVFRRFTGAWLPLPTLTRLSRFKWGSDGLAVDLWGLGELGIGAKEKEGVFFASRMFGKDF